MRGILLDEIQEQPEALEAVMATMPAAIEHALEQLGIPRKGGTVLRFVGCGDMHFAAECTAWTARRRLGIDVRPHRSMDLRWIADELDPERDLVVAASVSGRTPRTIEAARRAKRRGVATVAITANPGSPLTGESDASLLVDLAPPEVLARHEYAGYANQIAQTKSFLTVLLTELLVARETARCRGGTPAGLAALGGTGARVRDAIEPLLRAVEAWDPTHPARGIREVAVLGSGPWLPVARYAAAKQLEFAVPALAQCLEEYNHLETFVAAERTLVVLLAPDEPSSGRVRELAGPLSELGCRIVIVGGEELDLPLAHPVAVPLPAATDEVHRLFQLVLAVQLLALRVAGALGRDVDRWLGGRRVDLLNRIALRTIRGSEIVDGD